MKRLSTILFLLLAAGPTPAHALFGDEAILAMQYAEDKTFHAFMQIQMVQQLLTLKQNYEASVRYLNEFKQLNSGKGLFQNIEARVKTMQTQEDLSIQRQLNRSFVQTYNRQDTTVDAFFKSLDQGVANNIKYAGDEFASLIANRQTGQNIAANADGLAPKDAANLTAKAQGIQVQMLSQIHEDNLRLIQLQSMQLAAESRRQKADALGVDGLQQSLQRRFPGAVQPAQQGGEDSGQ